MQGEGVSWSGGNGLEFGSVFLFIVLDSISSDVYLGRPIYLLQKEKKGKKRDVNYLFLVVGVLSEMGRQMNECEHGMRK